MTRLRETDLRARHAADVVRLLPAILVLTVLGAALRIAAARGPLWLDEIWTFRVLEHVRAIRDVFLALPYDTNHPLTSAWLALVGPGAPPLVIRAEAILCGILSIPAAMALGARHGRLEALALGTIVALDQAFVQFGSEARGYAGLVLAILVACAAMERFLETRARGALAGFTAAIVFGTFSHLLMIEATAVLCAAGLLRMVTGAPRGTRLFGSIALLAAALLGTLPALVCLTASLATGPMHTGLATPFSWRDVGEGLGRLIRAEAGLRDGPLDATGKVALLAGAALAALGGLVALPFERRLVPAFAIALPLLCAAMRLPNAQYPRFHLVAGVGLALLAAAVWARAWTRGGARRIAAALVALAFLVGQGAALARFLAVGRGDPPRAVALMGKGSFLAVPRIQAGETAAVVRWFAATAHTDLRAVDPDAACTTPPDWLVVVSLPFEAAPAEGERTIAQAACSLRFAWRASLPAYGLSGFRWTLYRRLP